MWRCHSAAVTTTSVDKHQPLGTIMDRWAEARATATALEDTLEDRGRADPRGAQLYYNIRPWEPGAQGRFVLLQYRSHCVRC